MEIIGKYKLPLIIISLFCCFSLQLSAQNANDKAKKTDKGKGSVTVTQSAEIDALVNNRARQTTTTTTTAADPTTVAVGSETVEQTDGTVAEEEEAEQKPAVRHSSEDDDRIHMHEVDYTVDDGIRGPKIMRGTRKVRGYRIQVYTGGNKGIDRKKAEQTASKLKQKYPSLPVYVHFYSPRWICRCGNFHKYKEAEEFLKKIKKMGFARASIVRSQIMVNDSDKTYLKYKQNNEN